MMDIRLEQRGSGEVWQLYFGEDRHYADLFITGNIGTAKHRCSAHDLRQIAAAMLSTADEIERLTPSQR